MTPIVPITPLPSADFFHQLLDHERDSLMEDLLTLPVEVVQEKICGGAISAVGIGGI